MTDTSDIRAPSVQSIGPDELTELEALERAATPGRWKTGWLASYNAVTGQPLSYIYRSEAETVDTRIRVGGAADLDCDADAALIAALRNSAPRLFAALREAWAVAKAFEDSDNRTFELLGRCQQERYALRAENAELKRDLEHAHEILRQDGWDEPGFDVVKKLRAQLEAARGLLRELKEHDDADFDDAVHNCIDAALRGGK